MDATYTFTVQNVGDSPTGGPVTVTDTLPAGLSLVSVSGTNWNCLASVPPHQVSCTLLATPLLPNATAPVITVVVHIGPTAANTIINTAFVSTIGDTDTANNSSTDIVHKNAAAAPLMSLGVLVALVAALFALALFSLTGSFGRPRPRGRC